MICNFAIFNSGDHIIAGDLGKARVEEKSEVHRVLV